MANAARADASDPYSTYCTARVCLMCSMTLILRGGDDSTSPRLHHHEMNEHIVFLFTELICRFGAGPARAARPEYKRYVRVAASLHTADDDVQQPGSPV